MVVKATPRINSRSPKEKTYPQNTYNPYIHPQTHIYTHRKHMNTLNTPSRATGPSSPLVASLPLPLPPPQQPPPPSPHSPCSPYYCLKEWAAAALRPRASSCSQGVFGRCCWWWSWWWWRRRSLARTPSPGVFGGGCVRWGGLGGWVVIRGGGGQSSWIRKDV
jgi:hypothetical protein